MAFHKAFLTSSKGIVTVFNLVKISIVNIIGNDEFTNVELRRENEKISLTHCFSLAYKCSNILY